MAKTSRKRRRKHRGTQAGTVERAAHNSARGRSEARDTKPKTKVESRADARRKREERMLRPPTWRGTINRAGIAAAVLFALALTVLKQSPAQAVALAVFSLVLYVPLGYVLDRAVYKRALKRQGRGARGPGS